jgi:hypothetical protein
MTPDQQVKADILQLNMQKLALRLTGQAQATIVDPWEADIWTAAETDGDFGETEASLWYLGGGYWRARVVRDAASHMVLRVRLINPDVPIADRHTVIKAMRILRVLPEDLVLRHVPK